MQASVAQHSMVKISVHKDRVLEVDPGKVGVGEIHEGAVVIGCVPAPEHIDCGLDDRCYRLIVRTVLDELG